MKSILCYGDSNTWGSNPVNAQRHPYEVRWTSVLQQKLGGAYNVIPEGLNGRNT
jgi:lysophospholipase L1-like esterase